MYSSSVRHLLLACLLSVSPLLIHAGQAEGPIEVSAPPLAAAKAQIARLNATDNLEREDAERELMKIGLPALPLLKEAMKSADPETAARAKRLVGKLTEVAGRPQASYAEIMPANSIFFIEAANSRQTLDKLKNSPLGKFWDLPAMQTFYKGHREAQVPNDQKILDTVRELPKLLDGKVLWTIGAPDTAEAAELDPPMVYAVESKQMPQLEATVRRLFEGMTDPPKSNRRYGPFTVEEHITAQSVFGQESIIHSLTQKGIESFLDTLVKRPEKTLQPELSEVRSLLPQYDFIYHLSTDGFKDLCDNGQLIDDQQLEVVEKVGFMPGSAWQGLIAVTPDGFEDMFRLKIGGGEKNQGIAAVLAQLAATVPPPPQAGAPQALDLIPWQAGLLLSFQGDAAKNAVAIGRALRNIDEVFAATPPAPVQPQAPAPNAPIKPQAPPDPNKPVIAPVDPAKANAPKANTLGQKALAEGGLKDEKPQPPIAAEKGPAKAAAEKIPPHIARFEKLGMKLEQFLEQVDGPIQLALFMQHIEDDEAPDNTPISPLFAVLLKDPKIVEQSLEAAAAGPTPRFKKETLNGGTSYLEADGDEESRPGFWLKGNYLAWSSERDLLDLAGAALLHAGKNERMADRASYKQALAQKRIDPKALMTFFGDAEQVLEMPYKLAKINWQEDDANPWPSYDLIRPLLANKPIFLEFKAAPGGLQGHAITPLTLMGMIEAFRRPLIEAGFW
ncbi:MAG TPA: hypothetical protein VEK08_12665 [Planctomycetota bacterium]|nr:hypothetical protein [Planctomycetota bacterium]